MSQVWKVNKPDMSPLPSQTQCVPPPALPEPPSLMISSCLKKGDQDLREVASPGLNPEQAQLLIQKPDQDVQMELIENLNKFSRQKPGGFFNPIFDRPSPDCILCSQGSTCLGAYCLGTNPRSKTEDKRSCPTFPIQKSCPGLVGDTTLTSLIELRLGSPQHHQTSSSVLPLGKIFGWSKSPEPNSFSSTPTIPPHKSSKVSSRRRFSAKLSYHCSTAVYDRDALQALLRKCGGHSARRKPKYRASQSNISMTDSSSELSFLVSPSSSPVPRQTSTSNEVPKKTCQQAHKRKGSQVPKESSHQVPKKNLHQVSKKSCVPVPLQNDHTVPKKNCYQVKEQECDQVDRQDCKNVPRYLPVSQFINEQLKPEILRSSPTRNRSLRPSPPCIRPSRSSPIRSASASPNKLVRNRSKGHTPRKDTPRKKSRLQCRNKGCRDWFTSDDSRVRHENHRCKTLPEHSNSLEGETPVPSHADLGISPLQCRFPGCHKQYGQEAHRRRHELDSHRMIDKRGRTVSPSFAAPPPLPPPAYTSSRPQSCPPPQTDTQFVTPERPSKRRRITPASSTSSLLDSPTSPLASPNLSVTPKGSDLSSSETESDSTDQSESESNTNECHGCLTRFKNRIDFKRHNCSFMYDALYCKKNFIVPVILSPPKNMKDTRSILSQLCVEDQVNLCILQGWCLPFIYPFCFSSQQRCGRQGRVPVLDSLTASSNSVSLLRKMVEKEGEVTIPKHILLKDREHDINAYLSIEILTPPSDIFTVVETSEMFIVSKVIKEKSDDNNELTDKTFDSDDSDTMYACLRPESQDSDEHEYDHLPSPLYTPCQDYSVHLPRYTNDLQNEVDYGINAAGSDSDYENTADTHDGYAGDSQTDLNDEFENEEAMAINVGGDGGGDGGGDSGGDDDDDNGDEDRNGGDDNGDNDEDDNSANRENTVTDGFQITPDLLEHLPPDFNPGIDGMGAMYPQQIQAASYFRKPWQFPDSTIQSLIRHTKPQFFRLVLSCVGSRTRASSINIFAECFLLLLKLCHQISFEVIAVLFGLPSKNAASYIFYRQLTNQFIRNSNIPAIIQQGVTNHQELSKLFHNSYQRTPTFFKHLLANFEDPSGMGRLPVCLNVDATYLDLQGSADLELQKHFYYSQRSGHTVKVLNFTDLASKIVGLLPVSSSQSPASGDGLLISKHIELEDSSETGHYVRSILRGNDRYFVVLVADAGFVCDVPNAPTQAHGPSLAEVCNQEHAVLLHTSSKYEKYHFGISPQGKIRKIPCTPGNITMDENVVKFSRLFRKIQEQVHAGLKAMFRLFDMRHLWNSSLLPFTSRQLRSYSLEVEIFRDTPKLNFIVTVCCSLFNSVHPGFLPLYMGDAQQASSADTLLSRLFLENPLLYDELWPLSLDAPRNDSAWQEVSFGDLAENDILGFPKLNRDMINPVATDLVSGPHALLQADSLITYMHQLILKGQNLTREETDHRLESFPSTWKVQYLQIRAPQDFQPSDLCPRYCPDWWDEDRFGTWHDLTLVRCHIPPSYKSATTRSNFHWAVIGFGREPEGRMGFIPPYDRIYFFRCLRCPAKNGSMSMDRHLAALLKCLSFQEEYRPTSKTVNVLNTVAETRRQTTDILPPTISVNVPPGIQRRSGNKRSSCPLYNLGSSAPTHNVARQLVFPLGSSELSRDNTEENNIAMHHQDSDLSLTIDPAPSIRASFVVGARDIPPQSSPHSTLSLSSSQTQTDTAHNIPAATTVNAPSLLTEIRSVSSTDPDITSSGTSLSPHRTASPIRHSTQGSTDRHRTQLVESEPISTTPSSETQLSRYVARLDPMGVYNIPDASPIQPTTGLFVGSHLQLPGLLNDGNVCGIISILLSFNRMQILRHMIDPNLCFTSDQTPDYPSLVLFKIFSAMPSMHSFSIQLLILAWNSSGRRPAIQPGFNDIPSLVDSLVSNMQIKEYVSRPVFTRFLASFTCPACGKNHQKLKNWDGQFGMTVPLVLPLPRNNQPANIPHMLASYLEEPIHTRCAEQQCRHVVSNGVFETETGQYTLIAIDRHDIYHPGRKKMNKVEVSCDTLLTGNQLLGELVSCVCHRGNINHGHFVSYHKVGNAWFINDDSNPCIESESPIVQQTRNRSETVELLVFANNV